MKNIIDYLKERKNISFEEDPFNEVDGLVLSELVYADFGTILDESSDADIVSVNNCFWAIHTEEEILSSVSFTKMAPFLMNEMADSVRFRNARLKNYVTDISLRAVKQFGAITIELPDGTDFISYRGTNGTVAGWMEDFKFSFSTTDGQQDAVDYINKYHTGNRRPLRLGGHSKGGNLAVYAAVKCPREIQDNIKQVFSYDGPGFKMDILNSEEYERILPRILSVIPKECGVGIMMNNRYKTIITDSDARSAYQHDAYQWHIAGNKFEEVSERTELSFFFEKALNNWMQRCDEEKREKILDIFFTQIMNSDFAADDNIQLNAEFFHNLIANSPKLSVSDRAMLISAMSDVLVSTSVVTAGDLKTKSGEAADEFKIRTAEAADEFKEKSAVLVEELKEKSEEVLEEVREKISSKIRNSREEHKTEE